MESIYPRWDTNAPAVHHLPWTHKPAIYGYYLNSTQAVPANMEIEADLVTPPIIQLPTNHNHSNPIQNWNSRGINL